MCVQENMATMFRKSGNRKFRKKNFDVAEDEEDGNENKSTDNNVINTSTKEGKVKNSAKIEKTFSTNSLLSFDHDENGEDTEVFQVKKSKESRRLSKKTSKEKSKKSKPRPEVKEELEVEETPQENSPKDNGVDSGKLAALRAELNEMSKLDDEEDEEDNDSEPGNKPVIFSRRNEFNIPDAATIHALKKKREMARQLGTGQDFIPLDDSQRYEGRFDSKSRLVREDENDASDDDEGPISFSAVKNEQPIIPVGDSENDEEEEEDEETKRWEDEQIRKGVSASQIQQEKEQQAFGLDTAYQTYNIYPYGGGYNLEAAQQTSEITTATPKGRLLRGTTTEKPTMESILTRLKGRLGQLQDTHRGRMLEKEKIISHSTVSEESIIKLSLHGKDAERQYSFYQEMRGYVRDLIGCLNEKVGDTSKGGGSGTGRVIHWHTLVIPLCALNDTYCIKLSSRDFMGSYIFVHLQYYLYSHYQSN